MDIQFDLLVAIYVEGEPVSYDVRQNHPVPPDFQISQVRNGPNVDRLDLMQRNKVQTDVLRTRNLKFTHVYTRYNLADSNNSDAYYANNPLAQGLMLINMYAKARDVSQFYQVNIGPRQRPLIVLQLCFLTNPSIKEKVYDAYAFL